MLTKKEKYKLQVEKNITNHQHKISNSFCSLLPYDKKHGIESIKTFKSKSGSIQIWTNYDNPSKRVRKFHKLNDYPLSVRVHNLDGTSKPKYKTFKASECIGKAAILHALESFYSRVFLKECQDLDFDKKVTVIRPTKLNDLLFRDHQQALYIKACPLMEIIDRLLYESESLKREGDFIHNGFKFRVKNDLLVNRFIKLRNSEHEPLPHEYNRSFKYWWGQNERTGEDINRPPVIGSRHKPPTIDELEYREEYWDRI